jgi:tetratricopeptide (TPR) repeat protein
VRYADGHEPVDNLGDAEHNLGNHARAVTCYRHAISLCRDLGDRDGEAVVLVQLGDTHAAAGNIDAARDAWQRALPLFDGIRGRDTDHVRARLAATT